MCCILPIHISGLLDTDFKPSAEVVDALLVAVPQEKVALVADALISHPQVECPLKHHFGPGVYIREILMPKGTFVIGLEHKTEHFNIILKGRASVLIGGVVREINAGETFVSKVGVRKALYIHEDMTWQTVHVTTLTDLDALTDSLVITRVTKPEEIQEAMKALKAPEASH